MRTAMIGVVCVAFLGAAAGCSSSDSDSSPPTTVAASTSTSVMSAPPPTTASSTTVASVTVPAAPMSTVAPTSTASATTVPTTAPATVAPTDPPTSANGQPCRLAALEITLGETEGAMGNQYTPIVFTNRGSVTCTLDGHPGVSYVDASGNQVGESADRVQGSTPTVTLAVGQVAHATMDYHDPGFFDDCAPAPTASLKVYPPDETAAITIPFPSSMCTAPIAEPELTIEAVSPGSTI